MLSPLTFFKCLADDTRLKCLLLINEKNTLCVCDLQCALGLSQPKISRHLAELRKCQLLIAQRHGKWMYYQLHPTLPTWINEVLDTVANNNKAYLASCSAQLTSHCDNEYE